MRAFLASLLYALLVTSAVAYSPNDGQSPLINSTFSQAVANLPKIAHVTFGSSATAPTGCAAGGTCAAVTNSTQLGTYFSPTQSVAGTVRINSEWENYQPFTASANYVFNPSNLQLTGTLTAGQSVAPTLSGNIGSFNGSTNSFTTRNIGLNAASLPTVGQIFAQTYIGWNVITDFGPGANLASSPNDLSNATFWTLSGTATVTANALVAPDGTTTGSQIAATGGNAGYYQVTGSTTTTTPYTATGYFKYVSGNVNVRMTAASQNAFGGSGGDRFVDFNASTCAFVDKSTEISSTSFLVVNGWCRVTATYTPTSTGSVVIAAFSDTATTTFGVWGMQEENATGPSATISTAPLLGSSTTLTNFLPFEFLNAYYAATTGSAGAGTKVLTFSSVPAGVAVGMNVGFLNNTSNTNQQNNAVNSSQNYTVSSFTGTTVTLSQNLNGTDAVASGQGIFFWPGVNSAQIWTQATYNMPGQNGTRFFAMELTAQLPQNAAIYSGAGNISGAASNGANGSWVAFWLYGSSTSATSAGPDNSEIDDLEGYGNILRNMTSLDLNVHNPSTTSSPTVFVFDSPSWSFGGGLYTYNNGTDWSQANHKYQLLVTPTTVYWFVDGVMVKATNFTWTSGRQAQIGIDLAIGSWVVGLGTNNLYPVANTNFPMTYNLSELKVWGK